MTKNKSTKRALLMSALALLMCVSMLIGSTYAWFTDSVTSGTNKIVAGNLDVALYHTNGTDTDEEVTDTTKLFDEVALWEPGAMVWEKLTVKNLGSLALKYTLSVNVSDISVVDGKSFADVLKVAVMTEQPTRENIKTAETQSLETFALKGEGVLAAKNGVDEFYVAIYWAPTANDNDYNVADEQLYATLGVNLLATQYTYEKDSYDEMYDNIAFVGSNAALREALAEGKNVILTKDVDLGNTPVVVNNDMLIDLNGNTLSGTSTSSTTSYLIKVNSGKELTLTSGEVSFYATTPDTEWGGEGQPAFPGYANNAISCSGTLIVDGATIKNITAPGGASYAVDCYPGANLIVENGVIDGCGKVAIRTFANSATTPINVTINGGTVTGKRAIWIHLPSSNNTVAPYVNVTVNGGSLISTDPAGDNLALYSYSYGNSFANTKVAFNGGEYYGELVFGGGYKGDKETVTVNAANCKFNNDVYRYIENDGTELIQAANSNNAIATDAATLTEALKNGAKEIYAEGVVVEGTTQLNTGATIIGATFKNESGTAVTQTVSGTFKDCVFEGYEALRWCYSKAGETVVFENCTIKTDFRGVHFDEMKGNVVFKNCEINGFNAFGGDGTVTFEKCTFGNDASNYNGLNMYSNITLTDCTFNYMSGKTNFIDMEGTGKTLTITNCKATLDGVETNIADFVGGSKLAQNTVVFN